MLKFFSPRDDENESLLGAVTEGRRGGISAGWRRLYPRVMVLRVSVCVCVAKRESADAASDCAHSLRRLNVCERVAHICRVRTARSADSPPERSACSAVSGCGSSVALPPALVPSSR